jgi:hypothetical protein
MRVIGRVCLMYDLIHKQQRVRQCVRACVVRGAREHGVGGGEGGVPRVARVVRGVHMESAPSFLRMNSASGSDRTK